MNLFAQSVDSFARYAHLPCQTERIEGPTRERYCGNARMHSLRYRRSGGRWQAGRSTHLRVQAFQAGKALPFTSVVHVSTMRYSNDGHDTYDIVDLVKDSVRADSCRIGSYELMAQRLADALRVVRKGPGNEGNHCVKRLGRQVVQIALSWRTNLDAVGQRGFVVREARYSSSAIPRSPRAVAMSLPMSGTDRQNAVSSMASHSSAEMITAVARPFFVISTCSSKVSTSLMSALNDCRASASVTDFMYRILATFVRTVDERPDCTAFMAVCRVCDRRGGCALVSGSTARCAAAWLKSLS